uniref:Uncharacterized protein n=1 Tax=viral metagenome TaxID=1070528 RepID=A0A6C0ECI6_9ZZZZ
MASMIPRFPKAVWGSLAVLGVIVASKQYNDVKNQSNPYLEREGNVIHVNYDYYKYPKNKSVKISGKEFNNKNNTNTYYKIVPRSLETLVWKYNGEYANNLGLYFTTYDNIASGIHNWYDDVVILELTIPNDAIVVPAENGIHKSDKLNISRVLEKHEIFTNDYILNHIDKDIIIISYVNWNETDLEYLNKLFSKIKKDSFEYFFKHCNTKFLTDEFCIPIIEKYPYVIEYITESHRTPRMKEVYSNYIKKLI